MLIKSQRRRITRPTSGRALKICRRDVLQLSSVLIREEAKVQRPVYYVNRAIKGVETRYPLTEKWVNALIVGARKPKPYFGGLLHQVSGGQAAHQAGLGAGISVPKGDLHSHLDYGTQFTAGKIENMFSELDVEHWMASVSYPQANGQYNV
ncbi:hypothetical protein LIER_05775 [Lithospermum erythrorhizon]|uniref:Adenosine deaminase n=1 Tax=Lithospermum erythrorhizon TaxID=34254 RepID=A0AAV3P2P2_LITER